MRKLLIIPLLIFTFSKNIAQKPRDLPTPFPTNKIDGIYSGIEGHKLLNNNENIDGTPYAYPFMDAKVKGVEGTTKMRYNANNDEVEYETENGNLALLKLPKFSDIYFEALNLHLKLVTYNYNNTKITGYLYEIIDKPTVKIYRKEHITYNKAKPARTSYDEAANANFSKDKPVYFIKKGDAEIVEMPSNKKKLIEMYPEKKEIITQYFKNNRVDLSDSKDLQKLAEIL
ncbi:hypothetical protein [Halpernia sp.]|uniref:hypothetical protein n=1 Tax=Halpernia sp. TaxID=2782209 RepID=UPI003A9450B8